MCLLSRHAVTEPGPGSGMLACNVVPFSLFFFLPAERQTHSLTPWVIKKRAINRRQSSLELLTGERGDSGDWWRLMERKLRTSVLCVLQVGCRSALLRLLEDSNAVWGSWDTHGESLVPIYCWPAVWCVALHPLQLQPFDLNIPLLSRRQFSVVRPAN